MELETHQVYKKVITPWWDSNPACWILIGFLSLVLIFSLAGITVAVTTQAFQTYVWFPSMLALVCLVLIIKILVRMIRRSKTA